MTSSPRAPRSQGLNRSVFLMQLVMGVSVLALVLLLLVVSVDAFSRPTFFAGVIIVIGVTAAGAFIDWARVPRMWIVLLPVLDIIAVTMMRYEQPTIAVSFFYFLPVIWLSSYFDRLGTWLGAGLASVLYVTVATSESVGFTPADLPRILVVPITLAFVATATYRAAARNRAQRVILGRQSALLESALERSRRDERLLDEVLEALPFGVLRMDGSARIEFANKTYREWLDRQQRPTPGQPGYRVYADDGRTPIPEPERPFVRAARGEQFRDEIVWIGDPDVDDRAAYAVSSLRIAELDATSPGVVVVTRDVTTELEAVKTRDDLAASVTHELKNPLTSVSGYVELALDDPTLSPETQQYLNVVLRSSDRMLTLVTDLLDASRVRSVGLRMSMGPTDLEDIVIEAVADARENAGGIPLEIDRLESARVIADAFRIRQVIDNLVSNAIKYNRPGGAVSVSMRTTEDDVFLAVSDTGLGLTEEHRASVFAKYYRVPNNADVEGTGLGLSISRDIARQHGGDILVESESGVGSTFTVRLPRAREAEGGDR